MAQREESKTGVPLSESRQRVVSARDVAAYALPAAPATFLFVLTFVYFVKFSTDVLLVAPGVIALVFGLSRIWDAVSDPMAGFLSDRTRVRFGRRRSWVLASALPMALATVMLWSPPRELEGLLLVVWLTVGLFAFSTAYTAFEVPHLALGAELSEQPETRSLLYGARTWSFVIGSNLALTLGLAAIRTADDPRSAATWLTATVGLAAVACIALGVLRLRERSDYSERGAQSPLAAFRDVFRNRHARLLLVVVFAEYLGSGGAVVMITYLFDYVLDAARYTELNFVSIGLAQVIAIPVWIALSRRMQKKHVWQIAMFVAAVGCGLQFAFALRGSALAFLFASFFFGWGASATHAVGSALLADVIDSDELATGERKEGTYFATWHFTRKAIQGVMLVVAGLALQLSGFQPNVAQSEQTRMTILLLATLAPALGYLAGFLLLARFQLTGEVYEQVRAELAARRGE